MEKLTIELWRPLHDQMGGVQQQQQTPAERWAEITQTISWVNERVSDFYRNEFENKPHDPTFAFKDGVSSKGVITTTPVSDPSLWGRDKAYASDGQVVSVPSTVGQSWSSAPATTPWGGSALQNSGQSWNNPAQQTAAGQAAGMSNQPQASLSNWLTGGNQPSWAKDLAARNQTYGRRNRS